MIRKLLLLVLALVLVCGLALYGIWASLPLLLGGLARLVPVMWEEQLGQAVVAGMTRRSELCDDSATRAVMDRVAGRVAAAIPSHPYSFRVLVVRRPEVNALAAPGGHILVFSGLIERMENGEQLAAVIAHEMQHVVQRHSIKGILRALGLQAALTLAVGDVGVLGGLAGNLTSLHFLRGDEQSADDAALATLMRAGIPPEAMRRAFANLEREQRGQTPAVLRYLSSHPPLRERIERIESRSAAWRGPAIPLDLDFSRVCGGLAPHR